MSGSPPMPRRRTQSSVRASKKMDAARPAAPGWLHRLTSAGLMLAALALYGAGAASGQAGFVIAGMVADMTFWIRIAPHRRHVREARGG